MNLPNKLTLLRIAMVPVYLLFLALNTGWARWIALVMFLGAALTDLLDGRIARARGQVTNFGKFLDPIADKLLVILGLVLLVALGQVHWLVCVLFTAREFVVSGMRLIACEKGVVIAAGGMGKAKTVLQIVGVAILSSPVSRLYGVGYAALYAALALSLFSGYQYVWNGRALVFSGEGVR